MMKKLLLLGSAIAAFSFTANSQNSKFVAGQAAPVTRHAVVDFSEKSNTTVERTASTSYSDTLWYFFNKHYYRNTPANATSFYYTLSPNSGTFAITHHGSMFYNTGSLSINGLECLVAKHPSSPSAGVTVRMYLCNVSGGLPTFPAIDSLNVVATSTAGSFLGASWSVPKVVTSNYAVLFRTIPTVPGDSVKLYMNSAMTSTSSAAAAVKFGEGLGTVRVQGGTFLNTTNAYGTGTDYEYQVAPRIAFTGTTAQSSTTLAMCTNTAYVFSNNSSFWLGHRQYNLNEFYRKWKPAGGFANTNASIQPDSVYVWNFGDATPDRYTTSGVPSISKIYTTVGVYTVTLTSNYQKMHDIGSPTITDQATAQKTTSNCAVTPVGIAEQSAFETLSIYPNPTVNGKTSISGLNGTNTVLVYDMLGQLVSTQTTEKELVTIDLLTKANGSYFVKIINTESNSVKVVKIINQN